METTNNIELAQFIRQLRSPSFTEEPDLGQRLLTLRQQFRSVFKADSQIHVRAPGRAEILGNHTDYNNGYALSCAISRSTLAFMRKRSDDTIRIRSNSFPGQEVSFSTKTLIKDSTYRWTNYVRAVVQEMLNATYGLKGADILVDSSVPGSGGVSSSASFEVAIATGLAALNDIRLAPLACALLCKRAENGDLVGAPCGLLDQASVVFSESGKMVLMDFNGTSGAPLGIRLIEADVSRHGLSFVISVDPDVKRVLGDSGYPARRQMCEQSLPILSKLAGRRLGSLRELSSAEFELHKSALEQLGGAIMRMRVEHVVYENQRVLDGVQALEQKDFKAFAALLTASGKSALELYGLDEKTPELTHVLEIQRAWYGTLGTRNMGGGFSAIALSLMPKELVPAFEEEIGQQYLKRWGRPLQFIDFRATQGIELL